MSANSSETPLKHGVNTFGYTVPMNVCPLTSDKIRYMKVPFQRTINTVLAAAALLAGWWAWRWAGLVLAITVIAFWSILQFNRATRQLRNVADRPKGMVDSVVTLQSKLAHGMTMPEVLAISNSLGQRVSERGNDWLWRDSYGNQIVVNFRRGCVERWSATRTDGQNAAAPATASRPATTQEPRHSVDHASVAAAA